MSFYYPNTDPAYIYKRAGSTTDPYLYLNETIQVENGIVVLREIPNFTNKVTVKKTDGTSLIEVTTSTLQSNQYRVDYSSGVVYLHSSLEDTILNFLYYGTGYVSFPASRIKIDTNSDKTLQQLITEMDDVKTNWLTAVNTFSDIATTYPTPQLGDTVQTINDGRIYRFNGSVWVNTQQYTETAITNFQNRLDGLSKVSNQYEWTATEGQLVFILPPNSNLNDKWLDVTVGGASLPSSLVRVDSATQFTLLVNSTEIPEGIKVVATWVEPFIPATTGHKGTHEIGGFDEIDVTKLKNYQDSIAVPLTENIKKVNGFINIAEYNPVGDGITNDQTPIVNAVAEAKSKGYTLNWGWDNKTYLTTASIPDFHNVKHIGNAIIKRGTDLFYLSPNGTQRNKIYVATTGASNTFDGLSASQPVAKVQQAFDWIVNYSPILTGYWEVVLTAGTFVNRAVLKAGLRSENPIEITGYNVGTYPAVPTTIISEGVGASAVGIFTSNGSKIKVTNVKFTGFNGSSSSAGIKVANGSEVETSNCHFDSCYWGVSGEGRSRTVIPDGVFNNCGYLNTSGGTGAGIRSLQINNHQIGIQNNGNQTNTALFSNCYQAVLAQESSTGHVDWCTIQDCNSGIVVRVNARVNMDGTSFKRNTTDVRADANGHVYITSNSVFGTGSDESTNKVITSGGGNVTNSTIISGKELAYSVIDKTLDMVYTNQTVNTTSNTKVYTATLKSPFWKGTPSTTSPMKKMFIRVFGTLNGTNSNKSLTIRLGSVAASVTFTATETGTFMGEGWIYFNDTAKQYVFLKASRHLGTSIRLGRGNGTNPMTADIDLTVESQVDNTLDNVVIEMVEIGFAG